MRTVAEWFVPGLTAATKIGLIALPRRSVRAGDPQLAKTADGSIGTERKPQIRTGRAGLGILDKVFR